MCARIRKEGVTADGQPLSQNSMWWIAQKLREGRPTNPLWYTGGLSRPETYEIRISPNRITIQLRADYEQIHIDLIQISQRTGKNYKDWFGISKSEAAAV